VNRILAGHWKNSGSELQEPRGHPAGLLEEFKSILHGSWRTPVREPVT